MKVFQIENGICYWDATRQFPTVEATVGMFPPALIFVGAPDYVYEGWGFDPDRSGDERFVPPEPPEGWFYDIETGTFYPEGELPVRPEPTEADDTAAMLVDHEYRLTLLELGLTEGGDI